MDWVRVMLSVVLRVRVILWLWLGLGFLFLPVTASLNV